MSTDTRTIPLTIVTRLSPPPEVAIGIRSNPSSMPAVSPAPPAQVYYTIGACLFNKPHGSVLVLRIRPKSLVPEQWFYVHEPYISSFHSIRIKMTQALHTKSPLPTCDDETKPMLIHRHQKLPIPVCSLDLPYPMLFSEMLWFHYTGDRIRWKKYKKVLGEQGSDMLRKNLSVLHANS